MPEFIIQTVRQRPIRLSRSYDSPTLEAACQLAIADSDLSKGLEADAIPGAIFIGAAWCGGGETESTPASLPVPSQFREPARRRAEHFEVLLGLLKLLAHPSSASARDISFWRQRADAAIAKAEAILAGAPDPT